MYHVCGKAHLLTSTASMFAPSYDRGPGESVTGYFGRGIVGISSNVNASSEFGRRSRVLHQAGAVVKLSMHARWWRSVRYTLWGCIKYWRTRIIARWEHAAVSQFPPGEVARSIRGIHSRKLQPKLSPNCWPNCDQTWCFGPENCWSSEAPTRPSSRKLHCRRGHLEVHGDSDDENLEDEDDADRMFDWMYFGILL